MEIKCINCGITTRKYNCSKCNKYNCSFECYLNHKNDKCSKSDDVDGKLSSCPQQEIRDRDIQKVEQEPQSIIYRTEDTIDLNKLQNLDCKDIKQLLENRNLRDFLKEIYSTTNAWNAMKSAMLEPIFIEFANKCLSIVEPKNT